MSARNLARAGTAVWILLAGLTVSSCDDELLCPDLQHCAPLATFWLRSAHWPDGHYDVLLDSPEAALSCSFDVAQGEPHDDPWDMDGGSVDPVEQPRLGELKGHCVSADGRELPPFQADLSVGREVEIALQGRPARVSVHVALTGEPVFEQEVVPDYVRVSEASRCAPACERADVELDLQL